MAVLEDQGLTSGKITLSISKRIVKLVKGDDDTIYVQSPEGRKFPLKEFDEGKQYIFDGVPFVRFEDSIVVYDPAYKTDVEKCEPVLGSETGENKSGEPAKKKERRPKVEYSGDYYIEESHDTKRLTFYFMGEEGFYIDLPSKKVYHKDGTEFLDSHFDRISSRYYHMVVLDKDGEQITSSFTKRLFDIMRRVSSVDSARTYKLGTYIKAYISCTLFTPMEILVKAGIILEDRFITSLQNYDASIYTDKSLIDVKATTPHGILKCSKKFLDTIKKYNMEVSLDLLIAYDIFERHNQLNVLKDIIDIVHDPDVVSHMVEVTSRRRNFSENICSVALVGKHLRHITCDYVYDGDSHNIRDSRSHSSNSLLIELIEEMGYDPKSLVRYVYEVLPKQSISYDSIDYLIDYIYMCIEMGETPEKYPKYLRSMHDMASVRYMKKKRDIDRAKFDENMEIARENMSYSSDNYVFRVPDTPEELDYEGAQLCHCVASYKDKVIRGDSIIVFMRDKKLESKPLLTIELRKGEIEQVRGKHNRSADEKEQRVLLEYKTYLKESGALVKYDEQINDIRREKTRSLVAS